MKKLFVVIGLFLSVGLWAQDFYFVQITDTHLGYRNHDSITGKIVDKINALPFDVEFVVHTGDIFQNNMIEPKVVETYLDLKKSLNVPLYEVPGNHDLLPKKYRRLNKIYAKRIGEKNYIKSVQGVNLVFFYSIPFADMDLPDLNDQKEWISKTLENLKDDQVLLFHHHPTVHDFYNNEMHDSWPEEMFEFWTKMLNENNVDAVIAGHFHRDELHWLGDVPVYVASSIAGFWGRQPSFRVYHYQDGKLSYRTVYYYE